MVDKQQVIDFLKDLAGSGNVEINVNANTLTKFSSAWWKPQIYFCAWFNKDLDKRCGDGDFTRKKYIPVDIDIRLDYYKRTWKVLSHEEMMEIIWDIIHKLDNTSEFCNYSYAICSGNWLHLYYVGEEIKIDRDTYFKGVLYLQWMINKVIAPYKCDDAVRNIARIMRLPGTINPRKKMERGNVLWDLWDYVCDFILYRPGTFDWITWLLPELADEYDKENKMNERIVNIAKEYGKDDWKDNSKKSNWTGFESIDVWELAERAWWVKVWVPNWDIIPLKESHKNMGAYIYKPYNIVVNTWSSLILEKSKHTFNPWDIVYYEMMGRNEEKTLDYFKSNYHITLKKRAKSFNREFREPEKIDVPVFEYDNSKGFLYPASSFDEVFRCFMAGELVTICAESNSWKTTFALDIITRNNKEKGRKGFYVNLEFDIRNVWRQRWLSSHWYDKLNLTDLSPLPADDRAMMDSYVDIELGKFDTYNEPNWIELEDLVDILIERVKNWYELVVIDTLWDIRWFSGANSWSNQNRVMQTLQAVSHNTWLAIVLLHHMNRKWVFSGSNKIKDYSNVFIEVESNIDGEDKPFTTYRLTKDKFLWNDKEVSVYYNGWAYNKF